MTSRQLMTSATAGVLGLGVAVAGAAGHTDLAVAGLGPLFAGALILLVDIRRRQGDLATRLRAVATRQKVDSTRVHQLRGLPDDVRAAARRALQLLAQDIEQVVGQVEVAGESARAGIAHERLAATERHRELTVHLDDVKASVDGVRAEVDGVRSGLDGVKVEVDAVKSHIDRARADTVRAARDLTEKLETTDQASKRRDVGVRRQLSRLEYGPVRQVQALLQLMGLVEPRGPLPAVGGEAMAPSALLRLVRLVNQAKPSLVVECGSGSSTVWLAYTLEALGAGRVVSLEHDERYAAQTRLLLQEHGLSDLADVRKAPLGEITVGAHAYTWYDPQVAADLAAIDLLVVDGPPTVSGARTRYPALPVLAPRLTPGAQIVLPAAPRPDHGDPDVVESWLAETPGLVEETSGDDGVRLLLYRPA